MRVAVISDLHGNLPYYNKQLKGVELLLICGDIVPLNIQFNMPKTEKWLKEKFEPWVESLPIDKCYFIAGNHDAYMERYPDKMCSMFPQSSKITYIPANYETYISNDGEVFKIFGSPYCEIFGNWPFMRDKKFLKAFYNELPNDIDILISHSAPTLCEMGLIHEGSWKGEQAGSDTLTDAILRVKPRYVFCGHIHSGEHKLTEYEGIKLANTSVVNESYSLVYEPLILDINGNSNKENEN